MAAGIFNALKFLPASLGVKMIKKKYPKFKSFLADAAAYGYDADHALSYLSDRFGGGGSDYGKQLEANEGNLRPDEMAAQQQMGAAQQPGKIARAVTGFGGGALLAPGQEQSQEEQQQPTQPQDQGSPYGPQPSQAMQGAPKVQQAVGQIGGQMAKMQGASTPVMAGRAIQGAKSALGTLAQNRVQPKNPFDVFKRENPELGRFIEKKIGEGIVPMDAAKRAKAVMKFKSPIKKLEERLGAKFEDVVGQIFGGGGQQQQAAPSQAKSALMQSIQQSLAILGNK